jgi:hypothetical protein
MYAFLNTLGAMFLAATPLIQLQHQTDALFPFPTEATVDAWKRSESTLSKGMYAPTQPTPFLVLCIWLYP